MAFIISIILGSFLYLLTSAKVSDTTLSTLEDFYFATNGFNWTYASGTMVWDFSSDTVDPCYENWAGLVCDKNAPACQNTTCTVTSFNMRYMNLKGVVPENFDQLRDVISIDFSHNLLTGNINLQTYYGFNQLVYLNLNSNLLTGTLPSTIGGLKKITYLDLYFNLLYGSIPSEISQLSNLMKIYISNNKLSRAIPTSFGELKKLQYISLRQNLLSGQIPNEIGGLTKLSQLSLYDNCFSGTIPKSFSNLVKLDLLVLYDNKLSHTIPPELGNMIKLSGLYLNNNKLAGIIPLNFCSMTNLLELHLYTNSLSGPLPACLNNMTNLTSLQLQQNRLTGTIPSLMNLNFIETITLFQNQLTGTLHYGFAEMPSLRDFLIADNKISGNLDIFNEVNYHGGTKFEVLDLAQNVITGTIPSNLFVNNSRMLSVSLTENCFHGNIPEEVCEAVNLTTISMNGLTSGKSCSKYLYDPFNLFKAAFASRAIVGGIPSCIWQMTVLVNLYLAGNLLTGNVAQIELPYNSSLRKLGLSSNSLEGALSDSFQLYDSFEVLDLSFNKIAGNLELFETSKSCRDTNAVTTDVSLNVNRLTGMVPKCFAYAKDINVLGGNIFQCNNQEHPLPSYDVNSDSTICGSKTLNVSLILYVACLVFVLIVIGVIFVDNQEILILISYNIMSFFVRSSDWLLLRDIPHGPGLRNFVATIYETSKTMILSSLLVFFVGMIMYSQLTISTDTYSYQYGWFVSLCLCGGVTVSMGCYSIWLTTLVMSISRTVYQNKLIISAFRNRRESTTRISVRDYELSESSINAPKPSMDSESTISEEDSSWNMLHWDMSSFSTLRYSQKQKLQYTSRPSLIAAQVYVKETLVEHEMMGCNVVGLWSIGGISFINFSAVLLVNIFYVATQISNNVNQSVKFSLQFLLGIWSVVWNGVVVGYLVRLVNPSVRLETFLKTVFSLSNIILIPCISTLVSSSNCFENIFTGSGDISTTVEYETCAVRTFSNGNIQCNEVATILSTSTYDRPFVYNGGCSNAIFINYIPVIVYTYTLDLLLIPLFYYICFKYLVKYQNRIIIPHIIWPSYRKSENLLRGGQLFTNLYGHFGLLLTFGIASPYVAFIIAIAVVEEMIVYVFILRRYILQQSLEGGSACGETNESLSERINTAHDVVESASRSIPRNFTVILWVVLSVSGIFYSLILFDVVISEVNSDQRVRYIWVPLLVLCTLALFGLCQWLATRGDNQAMKDYLLDSKSSLYSIFNTNTTRNDTKQVSQERFDMGEEVVNSQLHAENQ